MIAVVKIMTILVIRKAIMVASKHGLKNSVSLKITLDALYIN